eukprot:5054019-Amphidinium_carterae.1
MYMQPSPLRHRLSLAGSTPQSALRPDGHSILVLVVCMGACQRNRSNFYDYVHGCSAAQHLMMIDGQWRALSIGLTPLCVQR